MAVKVLENLEDWPQCPFLKDGYCDQLQIKIALKTCALCKFEGPFCGKEIAPDQFARFKRAAVRFTEILLSQKEAKLPEAVTGWQTAKKTWQQADSFFAAVRSRGLTATLADVVRLDHSLGKRVADEVYDERRKSCFGTDTVPPCPQLVKSNNGMFCGACGCGEKKLARLDDAIEGGYTKLHYPELDCPLRRPGFSNHDPSSYQPSPAEKEVQKYQEIYASKSFAFYGHSNHGKKALPFLKEISVKSVLDVGCGHNEFCKSIRAENPAIRAVGVDIACPGADRIATATRLPFESKEFDVITAFDALEHLLPEQVSVALKEFARVSSRFIFSISHSKSVYHWKGQTLHPTVEDENWWIDKITKTGGVNVRKEGKYLTGEWISGFKADEPSALSVVIPVLNDNDEVNATIASLRKTSPSDVEVIVVDDGSDIPVKLTDARARLIRNEKRIGTGRSRHDGIVAATKPYILLVDSHMRFVSGWYENAIARLKTNPKTLWCGQALILTENNMDPYKARGRCYGGQLVLHDRGHTFWVDWAKNRPGEDDYEISCALGACYFMHRDWYLHLKGLQSNILYGSEEPTMCLKSWLAGGEVRLAKSVKIGHKFKKAFPYKVEWWHIYYNKLRPMRVLLPANMYHALLTKLPAGGALAKAKELIEAEAGALEDERKYYQSIFVRDFNWFCSKFNIKVPELICTP